MAVKKPVRPKQAAQKYRGGLFGQGSVSKIKSRSKGWKPAKKKPQVRQAPRPAARPAARVATPATRKTQTVTPVTRPRAPATIPRTPQGELRRQGAQSQFAGTEAETNRQLYEAALGLGDPQLVEMYSKKGYGPAVPSPVGELQNLAQSEEQGVRSIGERNVQPGTFFSGRHLTDVGQFKTQTEQARQSALQRYQAAERRLMNALAAATRARDLEMAGASVDEYQAAMEAEPEPTGTEVTDYNDESSEEPGTAPTPAPTAPTSRLQPLPPAQQAAIAAGYEGGGAVAPGPYLWPTQNILGGPTNQSLVTTLKKKSAGWGPAKKKKSVKERAKPVLKKKAEAKQQAAKKGGGGAKAPAKKAPVKKAPAKKAPPKKRRR